MAYFPILDCVVKNKTIKLFFPPIVNIYKYLIRFVWANIDFQL